MILTRLRFAVALFVPVALVAFTTHLLPQAVLTSSSNFSSAGQGSQIDRVQHVDLRILHGKLVDGSGNKPHTADVGIRGDRIVFVGDARYPHLAGVIRIEATRTLDATGLVVAPGFIDPHTHTLGDLSDEKRKGNEAYLMQGVTTVVTGNEGGSALNIGENLSKWDQQGIGTNAIMLAGFGRIRGQVPALTDARANEAPLG